jgi:hypothetical protein
MKLAKLSSWDVAYALDMCIACAISYWVMTHAGISILARDANLLGVCGRRWRLSSCLGKHALMPGRRALPA